MTATATVPAFDQDRVRAALANGAPDTVADRSTASGAFLWRAMLKIKHVPEQLFDVTAFPIVFLLMFTYLFGGAVAGSTADYLQEVLPGILVLTVTFITMYTGLSLNRDIHKGVHDRFRTLPLWQPATVVGPLVADVIRYALAATVMLIFGLVLGFRPEAGPVGVLAAVALLLGFAFSLSWVWTSLGLVMRSETALTNLSTMLLFPLTFVSNVFVPTDSLPGWLEPVVDANPITQLVSASRGLMHGTGAASEIAIVLGVSGALIGVFGPLTMVLYRRLS